MYSYEENANFKGFYLNSYQIYFSFCFFKWQIDPLLLKSQIHMNMIRYLFVWGECLIKITYSNIK